jgi:predicted NBD/HSP70 family sugar kinase
MTTRTGITSSVPPRQKAARQDGLRAQNIALVLQQIANAPTPMSRAEVAAATGLTKATVSALVDTLRAGRLVSELEPRLTRPTGRPAIGLALDGGEAAGVGLEINVDYLAACVINLAGEVRHREVVQDDQRGRAPERSCTALAAMASRAIDAATGQGMIVAGLGVAVPGLVDGPGGIDGPSGVLRFAPNLGWRDIDVRKLLAQEPGLGELPINVGNEANFAALGELYSDRSAMDDFLHVSGEIGVGAGIVKCRELFHGTRGWSGELGHVTVDMDGPRCRCGAQGCLEQLAGQEAILRGAGLSVAAATSLGGQASVTRIVEAARLGDTETLAALRQAGRALGVAVAGTVNLLDLPGVVLGGIYAPLAPWIAPEVQREVDRRVLSAAWAPVAVRVSKVGIDAAVLGAAGGVTHAILRDPAEWLRRRDLLGEAVDGPAASFIG